MLNRIQLYIYVTLAMGLMVTALALSIDGDTFGSVVVAIGSFSMFIVAMVRDRLND